MPVYHAPLAEMRFLLHDLLDVGGRLQAFGDDDAGSDLIDAVLEGGARFMEEAWAPLNQAGDRDGCRYDNGVVRTPDGFKQAFDAYYAGGWNLIATDPKWGGQGLPGVLAQFVSEMGMSANLSLSTYVGLTSGVAGTLMRLAPEAVQNIYLPKLLSGAWTGTMNLTEPHCGTDLKLMRTKAEPQADGSYLITGTKIFITGGEHDMAENIAHLVLAKVPDEGEGLAAVSLFLVPKYLVNEDGTLGPRNGVTCGGIEDKMGIRGSATAQLHYERAVGLRLGPRPTAAKSGPATKSKRSAARGMSGMFTLMNAARLGVGLQGVAMAEVAYQNAVIYARERQAGRALTGAAYPDQPADPIIVHPDIRRMLLFIRAFVEGARALLTWLSFENTLAQRARDGDRRRRASDLMNLLTPVIKAHFTDTGFACTNMAMQCFGGHGYVRDHGMEQFVRDARISQLYEGANGVQALDLVGRRLPADDGRAIRELFQLVAAELETPLEDGGDPATDSLQASLGHLVDATTWLAKTAPGDRNEAGAASADYLSLLGLVMVGYIWHRMAATARARLAAADGNADFLEMKQTTARFYLTRVLPETAVLLARVKSGAGVLMAPRAEQF